MPLDEAIVENEDDVVEVHLDPSLKLVWVDSIRISKRDDGLCCMSLSANVPEGLLEQTKFMTNQESLKEFVNVICSVLNYYPSKPTKSGKKTKPVK